MASAHLEVRREFRYNVPFEIEISGVDRNGKVFRERTLTEDVSEWGCGFLLSVELKTDDMIALRVTSGDPKESAERQASLFQVRHVEREKGGWRIGAWKMDAQDVWGINLEEVGKPEDGGEDALQRGVAKRRQSSRRDADP